MDDTKLIQVLSEARDLFAANPSHVSSMEALPPGTYCAVTAVSAALQEKMGPEMLSLTSTYAVCEELRKTTGCESVVNYVASHTTEQVVDAFDQTIARLKVTS